MEGFHEAVAQSLAEPVRNSCPLERVSIKLKRLTWALQSWSQKRVGHIKTQHRHAHKILYHLEIAPDCRPLTSDEDWLQREAKRLCLVLSSLERTIARLRSPIRFLKDGDANTELFHKTARFCQKVCSLFLKLDISKAFNSVAWPFLLEVLEHFGFGPIWRSLRTSSTRILVNGQLGEEILHQRGL